MIQRHDGNETIFEKLRIFIFNIKDNPPITNALTNVVGFYFLMPLIPIYLLRCCVKDKNETKPQITKIEEKVEKKKQP